MTVSCLPERIHWLCLEACVCIHGPRAPGLLPGDTLAMSDGSLPRVGVVGWAANVAHPTTELYSWSVRPSCRFDGGRYVGNVAASLVESFVLFTALQPVLSTVSTWDAMYTHAHAVGVLLLYRGGNSVVALISCECTGEERTVCGALQVHCLSPCSVQEKCTCSFLPAHPQS